MLTAAGCRKGMMYSSPPSIRRTTTEFCTWIASSGLRFEYHASHCPSGETEGCRLRDTNDVTNNLGDSSICPLNVSIRATYTSLSVIRWE